MICTFCGEDGDDSQEHVFPKWMRDEFPEIGVVDYSANYENAGAGEEPRRRTWSAPAFTHTVGGICRRCNNGWMSHLEAVAKPVLLGPMKGRRARWSSTEQVDAPPPDDLEPSNSFHATMVVGALAFRVVGHDLLGADIGEPRPARSWSRIEPTPGPVRWPPPETMGQPDLVEAVETFPGDDGWMNDRLTVT